jgi:putative nucleotidyltransferase with HDIG domain
MFIPILPPGTDGRVRIYPFRGRFKKVILAEPLSDHPRRLVSASGECLLTAYAATLAMAAAGMGVVLFVTGESVTNPWVVLILAFAAATAERGTVRLTTRVEVSVGLLPTLFAAVVCGPLAAMAISGASMLGDLRRQPDVPLPHLRWLVYTSTRAVTGAVAGLIALRGSELVSNDIAAIAVSTALAVIALESLDISFFSLTMWLRRHDVSEALRAIMPVKLSGLPLFAPVVGLLAFTYQQISPWTLPLFLVPAFAAQRLSILYQEQRRLADDLINVNALLERANLSFAAALVATLDARDRYTAGHSTAVANYASQIAVRMGLPEKERQLIHLSGLVHDVGKVGLSVGLLEKSGSLTLAERRQMERHATIGEMILAKVNSYEEIALIVRHHHERVDGRGYPDGLAGDTIPLPSRIIAVADAYDAMTSDRPYRGAMTSRIARLRLAQAVGTQFDTSVVAAFEAVLADQRDPASSVVSSALANGRHSVRVAVQDRGAA